MADPNMIKRLEVLRSHPRYFIKHCVFTKDGNRIENPKRAFPYQLEYHQQMIDDWYDNRLFACIKSRQMQVTLQVLACHLWLGLFRPNLEIYFRRAVFEDALKLLEDMEFMYDNIPEDILPKDLYPRKYTKEGLFSLPSINTNFYAVASGKDKMRGRTPSAVFLDEFAFQEDDDLVYKTLKPSIQGGARVSIISTPKPLFGLEDPYFRKIVEDRTHAGF